MKRFSLWFAVAVVLFSFQGGFSRPTKSQLDSLEALAPATITPTEDTIRYDFLTDSTENIVTTTLADTNYWIGVRFYTGESLFTLQAIYFEVANPLINHTKGCTLIVVNDSSGYPSSTRILDTAIAPSLPNRLYSCSLTATPSPRFDPQKYFWILLGPVPAGPDNDLIGQGWWGFADSAGSNDHSFITWFPDSQLSWTEFSHGNWVLRAGGKFTPPLADIVVNEVMFNVDRNNPTDSTRNHEWVELFNAGDQLAITNGWKILNGSGDSSNVLKHIAIPNGINFPSKSYLVIHITKDLDFLDTNFADGRGDIYIKRTSDPQTGFFGDRKDACALFLPGFQPVQPAHKSLISWNLTTLSVDSTSSGLSVETFFSQNGRDSSRVIRIVPDSAIGPLLTAGSGVSIGRDSSGTDSSIYSALHSQDVSFIGGPQSAGPTMGRKNHLPMLVNDSAVQSTPVVGANWTVMLYFAADNAGNVNAQERWCYDLLNQIERAIPSSGPAELNVVVQFDSRQAYPKSNPSNKGTTFRGVLKHDETDAVKNLVSLGELNTGNPTTLAEFIDWAKDSFPATQYILALKGDGAGWQGLCGDATDGDRLEMGELKSALQTGLGGTVLELLILDAPLMNQVEVASQVKDYTHFMVASPEMTGPADLDYGELAENLEEGTFAVATPQTVAEELVTSILEGRRPRGSVNAPDDRNWFWVAMNLDNLGQLLSPLNLLATNLKTGIDNKCATSVSVDNFQLYIQRQLRRFEHYGTQAQGMADFVDLKWVCYELRTITFADVSVPTACDSNHLYGTREVDSILKIVGDEFTPASPVILTQSVSNASRHFGNAGLSIYYPSSRQRAIPIDSAKKSQSLTPVYNVNQSEHPFDVPGLSTEGGIFDILRMYARDTSFCYPHASGCTGDSMAQYYPLPVVPDFTFVNNTQWDEFLNRYYKPVADGGQEQIFGNLNQPVDLDASGSSDADDEASDLRYYWDLRSLSSNPGGCDLTEEEDLDKNCIDDASDDVDATGKTLQYSFSNSGDLTIWLHVWDDYDGTLSGTNRGYHTAKDSSIAKIAFQGVHLVVETTLTSGVYKMYDSSLIRLGVNFRCNTPLSTSFSRQNASSTLLSSPAGTCPSVIWTTAGETDTTFPPNCQTALDMGLNTDNVSVWICAPLLGNDTEAASYFEGKLPSRFGNVSIDSSRNQVRVLLPAGGNHFLNGLVPFALDTTSGVPLLQSISRDTITDSSSVCPTFPILVADNGDTVAVARVLEDRKHAIIYSTFSLEQLANTADMDILMRRVLGWMASPVAPEGCACPATKGDMNGVGGFTPADVVLMLNCVFPQIPTGTVDGACGVCYADVNCSGGATPLSPADVVLELLKVFNGENFPCQ